MKQLFTSLLLCFGMLKSAVAVPATVDYIFDGDTFAAVVHLENEIDISARVRLINIDTPEIHGMCEKEISDALHAKERLSELIPIGSLVELKQIKDDKYLGRIDAYVILPDGRDVGEILIKEKLGRPYSGGRRQSWCN